jgi:hypothetical protein
MLRLSSLVILGTWTSVESVRLRADPYVSNDQQVRLSKQRLLSMDPNAPGIRYRLNDQLTNLMNMDQSISTLEHSVLKFQQGLSEIAGVIDVSKSSPDGLVPQMQKAIQTIARLDTKLKTLHRQAQASIQSLYNTAKKIPVQLTSNLQSTLNNLVTLYNQQIINQVHTLDRQRNQAISTIQSDTRTLNRTVSAAQTAQMVDVRKLLKTIQSNRVDLLTQTALLTGKLAEASNIVNTALAGVKTKADQDMTAVQGIINQNKQTLTQYLTDKGNDWNNQLQGTIAKAAKQVSKSLVDMSKSLTDQFAASKKKATSDLEAVDRSVDVAVQTAGRSIASAQKQFDLAIKNATQVTDSVLADLSVPINDMRDQITAATNILSSTQNQVTLAVSGISQNASAASQALVSQFQTATKGIATNPAFANLTTTAGQVSAQASSDMQAVQTSAQAHVAALESQLGSNDQTLGSISSSLQDTIAAQKADFDTQTKLQSSAIQTQVSGTTAQLQGMASENAAMIDDAKASADQDLADATGRMMSSIQSSHDAAQASIASVGDRINQSVTQANTLIQSAFGGIVSDSQAINGQANALADAADITENQVANLSSSLAAQNKLVSSNIASATSQLGMLKDLGSSAIDNFGNAASASTASAVGDFSKNANQLVDSFASNMQNQMGTLNAAQQALTAAQTQTAQTAAATQAQLSANLTNAKNLLNAVKANSSLTDSAVQSAITSMLSDFKQGSLAEVSNLKSTTAAQLQSVANDLKNRVAGAGDAVSSQTKGFVDSLVSLSSFVSAHASDLDSSVSDASGAVSDFKNLVDKMVSEISSMSDDLNLYYQNTSSFVNGKLDDTESLLNESQADAMEKIQSTWDQLRSAMETVDGSTAKKITQFQASVNESIAQSDSTVKNFTDYLDAMIEFERNSAASRLAIQRGILNSIIQNAQKASASSTSSGTSAEMIKRLQTVLGTAQSAVNASSDQLAQQQAAQNALIDSFGLSTAQKVDALLGKLQGNSDAFIQNVNASSLQTAGDSQAMLRAAGMGVQGVVGLAKNIAGSVDIALNDTARRYRDSQVAMAALSAETNGLSNITEAQLSAIIEAMMNSQNMFSSELDAAKTNNSQSIALISGVIRDFVFLVNQTLAESDDLISAVDANYTNASMALGAKMDTILGFINREAGKVSESADTSSQSLKGLLTRNGAMEEGIQTRLQQLSSQQDAFAKSVHDQLQAFISRLNDDSSKLASARQSATNKLYDALHNANAQFAANAAQWQNQRLTTATSLLQEKVHRMSDRELVEDVNRHLRQIRKL